MSDVETCPVCSERKNKLQMTPVGWRTYHQGGHGTRPDPSNIKVGKHPAAEEINPKWKEYP